MKNKLGTGLKLRGSHLAIAAALAAIALVAVACSASAQPVEPDSIASTSASTEASQPAQPVQPQARASHRARTRAGLADSRAPCGTPNHRSTTDSRVSPNRCTSSQPPSRSKRRGGSAEAAPNHHPGRRDRARATNRRVATATARARAATTQRTECSDC